ncbi:MAG: DUF4922 domain-containing protein [Melioribacteraceae bacterium]|nr:DUF4922 domain-containing protein [Melioribacteraceae bacterium]MCF8356502.1 DUF4922 domain-containing protein [Melioribacteraceae bacterium]MCF8395890.1 DUF4922 domain-containing protein [Melioribacteraceae bacterium]MCF8420947.1 DUF4922 domain-containing protein [Melioribacteraceae bacterium]
MINEKIVSDAELNTDSILRFDEKVELFFRHQLKSFNLLSQNYGKLENVEEKIFSFDKYDLKIQFNPERVGSSTAEVDEKTISNRKCFLCPENLYPDQKALKFGEYLFLCNPFPIFKRHFTIPAVQHMPQQFKSNIDGLLDISRALGEKHVLFYNGPGCGASAPDHFHFQAGDKSSLPLFNMLDRMINSAELKMTIKETNIISITNYAAPFIYFESQERAGLKETIKYVFNSLSQLFNTIDEPGMNVLAFYEKDNWKIVLFPRIKHRPSHYFDEENKVVFSPASVDLSGLCILPRKRDFDSISKETLREMIYEVAIDEKKMKNLFKRMQSSKALL